MDNCIFCKIVNGEIPSAKVFENEDVLAFLDISQVTKGHTLIIPKKHCENVFELDEKTAQAIFKEVPKVANALKKTFQPVGLNLLQNNGKAADQSVFHFHIHLLPRYGEYDGFSANWKVNGHMYQSEDFTTMAKVINENI